MSRNGLSGCILMLTGVLSLSALGVVETADFVGDAYGNTNQWELSETTVDGNGRVFMNDGEAITSPTYDGAVVSLSLSAKMFGSGIAGSGSALIVEARSLSSESWDEVCRLVFVSGAATNETFTLPRGDNYRQFRLAFVKGVGTLRVGSFEATWRADGEVAVPHSLNAAEVNSDSFQATWAIDEPVECFLVDCWRESMTPWAGDKKWTEAFSKCVNATKNAKKLTSDTFDQYTDLAGWSGDYVYLPSGLDGVIQVNKTVTSVGWLVSPGLPALGSVELVVRTRAYVLQPDHVMPVFLIRDGATNEVASFELTESFKDCHCQIPEIREGDRLAFKSFSVGSQRRVLIDSVSLVEGFVPGAPITNFVCESEMVEYSENPGYLVEGLSAGSDYSFSVRAVSGGVTSETSAVCGIVTKTAGDVEDATEWSGVEASDITHASFRLDWPTVSGAAEYRVSVWTNVLQGASPGTVLWSESFSKAMASEGTTAISSDEKFGEDYADSSGWTIVSNVYPSVDAGTVRIGNTSKPGELMAPAMQLPEGCTLRVLARRQTAGEGAIFSAWRRSGDELFEIGEPCEIGEAVSECVWTLPEMGTGDCLVFRSGGGKKSYRTILDEVVILDGYSAGSAVPDYAVNSMMTDGLSYSDSDLTSAVWAYAVEAVDGAGAVIAAATNRVDLINPPPRPVLDAISVSEVLRKGGVRIWQEDFSAFTNVFPAGGNSADWVNGTTLPHWQAYYGGEAVTGITRNQGAKNTKGLYAYWATNELAETYSLGTMTTDDAEEFVYGIAFRNDTVFSARKVSVKYDGIQFGFKNSVQQTLVCECLVTNELVSVAADGAWMECADLSYSTSHDNESGLVSGKDLPVVTPLAADIVGLSVPKDHYFLIRWRRSAVSNGAAMAIDNLSVSFLVQSRPMTIVVR
jgi:hypothetical protein